MGQLLNIIVEQYDKAKAESMLGIPIHIKARTLPTDLESIKLKFYV